jgi:hypothetical protein
LRRRGQGVPRRSAMPDAGGAPLIAPAPDHLSDGLELAAALDSGVEQGHRRPRRSSGGPRRTNGPARCHGSRRGRVAARRLEARKIWLRKIFGREVAAVVCCGKGEGAFSAKLLKGGSQGVVSEASALTRWFEKRPLPHYARSPRRLASPTARVPRAHDLRFFTWTSDRTVDACRWRAQQLLGPPALRSLERARLRAGLPGATVGVLDTGVSRSTCSWAMSSAHLRNQRPKLRRRPSRGGAS